MLQIQLHTRKSVELDAKAAVRLLKVFIVIMVLLDGVYCGIYLQPSTLS